MRADAVIFDKDGTLLDFDAFWVTVSVKAIEDVLARLAQPSDALCEILEAFGVHQGVTDINGVLCKGTYGQMGELVYEILRKRGCTASCREVTDAVVEAYGRHADEGEIKATCPNLAEQLTLLKQRGKKLAVVTTDNEAITRKCLQGLGIEQLFDRIYTDDGVTPTKPDPFCVHDFCRRTGIAPAHTVMVGDTVTDIRFAKNAGIAVISVARTDASRAELSPMADVTVSDLSALADLLQ